MSFSLSDVAQDFKWPVDFKKPLESGDFKELTFVAKFRIMDSTEIDSFSAGLGSSVDDERFVNNVVVGWDAGEIFDASGNPVKYTDAVRQQVAKIPYIRNGIISSYFRAMKGGAREKN